MSPECAAHPFVMQSMNASHMEINKKLDFLCDEARERGECAAAMDAIVKQLKESDVAQWSAIDTMKKYVYIGVGICVVLQGGVLVAVLKLAAGSLLH